MTNQMLDAAHNRADDVRELFWSTLVIGEPLNFRLAFRRRYESLALGWYLKKSGSDSVVAVVDDKVVGYALVCRNESELSRWMVMRTPLYLFLLFVALVSGRLNAPNRRFYANRVRDMWAAARVRHESDDHPRVSAHVNILGDYRSGAVALLLRDHVDRIAVISNEKVWLGEVSSVGTSRLRALARVVGEVQSTRPCYTLSGLSGEDVLIASVVRRIAA
jgi:hypothetical protein